MLPFGKFVEPNIFRCAVALISLIRRPMRVKIFKQEGWRHD